MSEPVYAADTLDQSHMKARAASEVAEWLLWLQMEGKAPRTVVDYERPVARLLLAHPDLAFNEFTDAHCMKALVTHPAGGRRVIRAVFQSWFSWGVLTGRLDRNPMDRVPKIKRQPQKLVNVFTDEECALLEGLPVIDGCLMTLMLHAGLRKSECRRLQRKHILLERMEIVIYQGKGGKDRLVPFGEMEEESPIVRAVADLDLFEQLVPDDHLWYSRPGGGKVKRSVELNDASFHRWWCHCVERAGITYRNPHTTRHTYATRWRQRGLAIDDLQVLLGHANVATTASIYVHTKVTDVAARMRAIAGNEAS